MAWLNTLVNGQISEDFPYLWTNLYEPSSIASLTLCFFPESLPLKGLNLAAKGDQTLNEETANYVREECAKWGFTETLKSSVTEEVHFYQCFLRKCDQTMGKLVVPTSPILEADEWTKGVLRPFILLKKFGKVDFYLSDFEAMPNYTAIDLLFSSKPDNWDLRQLLEFLVGPYARYTNCWETVRARIAQMSLVVAEQAAFVPELGSALLELCLQEKCGNFALILKVCSNLKPQEFKGTGEPPLTFPNQENIFFIESLAHVAARFPEYQFSQLAEWSLSGVETQKILLSRFLNSKTPLHLRELQQMHTSLIRSLDWEFVLSSSIKSSLIYGKLMFLKSVQTDNVDLVRQSVLEVVDLFAQNALPMDHSLNLPLVVAALDLVKEPSDKYKAMIKYENDFKLSAEYMLKNSRTQWVLRAIEKNSRAYLQFTELKEMLNGEKSVSWLAEQCIEAALVDDNIQIVYELIDERQFLDPKSPDSWLAFYQAGKYVSPNSVSQLSKNQLLKQQRYLSQSAAICPQRDLRGVLQAWKNNQQLLEEVSAQDLAQLSPQRSANLTPANINKSVPRTSSEPEEVRPSEPENNRDPLSNLLVSGIGWAIGANPSRSR